MSNSNLENPFDQNLVNSNHSASENVTSTSVNPGDPVNTPVTVDEKVTTFLSHECFYTLMHKFLVININSRIPNSKQKLVLRHSYRIIYGHFMEDEDNTFLYANVSNKKPFIYPNAPFEKLNKGLIHKCKITDLQKPNSFEPCYVLHTYAEAKRLKDWYKANYPDEPYEYNSHVEVIIDKVPKN